MRPGLENLADKMLDFGKLPFEKAIHLLTKVLPGIALLFFYNSQTPGSIAKLLSLPYLGYATRVWLFIAICFALGYTFSTVLGRLAGAVAGAIGALWYHVHSGRHPYEFQTAPWRDPNWREAYISRYGSEAPKNLTLVLPGQAAELLKLSQPLPPGPAEQQKLAEAITLQINADLMAAVDAITNDSEWRVCYDRMKIRLLLDRPLEVMEEIMGQLDSDFSLASAIVLIGSIFSSQFRVWWLVVPAASWLIVATIQFCAKAYQFAQPWSTLSEQIETLKSGK